MLKWMYGHTINDRIRNDYISEKIGVASIEEKMIENRLRQFGHAQKGPQEALIRKVDCMIFSLVKRRKERPKRTLEEIIKGDLKLNNISETQFFKCAK